MSLVISKRKRTKINDRYARGVPEISRVLQWPERQTRYALEQKYITAGRLGSVWIADKEKLLEEVAAIAAGEK
jgi:hypothetical protein